MPVLVLAAKLCPPGMEATLFATLMSISNAGSVTGSLVGAGLGFWSHEGLLWKSTSLDCRLQS